MADVRDSRSKSPTYEELLARDLGWALSEGGRFFEGDSAVQRSLRRIASRLDELGIPYAVAGGMALFAHGYKRFTDDVDILVTRESLDAIHAALDGRGWVRPFEKSKNLRDAEHKVKIEFLLAGDFPGDGKAKPVSFPDPETSCVVLDGIAFLDLKSLVELKLASGLTGGPDREKDFVDIRALMQTLDLPESLADRLDEYVRPKFVELRRSIDARPKRYLRYWSPKSASDAGFSLDEALAAGLTFEPRGETNGQGYLVATDRNLAKRFGLEDESEFLLD